MPITGASSYPPTTEAFLSHWETANTAVGSPVTLEDGTARADLVVLRDDLEAAREGVTGAAVDLSLARGALAAQLAVLQVRMVEFNARVRGDLAGSPFPGALPEAFALGQAEGVVREALRRMARVWGKINELGSASPPGVAQPYTLSAGLTLAAFEALRTQLREAYRTVSDAQVDLSFARGARNTVQDAIYPRLKAYRQKLVGLGAAHPALLESLPALSPAGGHTPEPVAAAAVWNAPTSQAKVTWSASPEPALARYEVRADAGEEYETEDESLLLTVPPEGPREVLTDFALGTPGLTTGFKVYVVLDTGNERGSDAVYVTRPG